jgi:hypothetical protein
MLDKIKAWFLIVFATASVWIFAIVLYVLWTFVVGGLISLMFGDIEEYLPAIMYMITAVDIICIYVLVGITMYHLVLKNLPYGERKARYWFLIGFSLCHIPSELDKDKESIWPEWCQKFNSFMVSLLIR